MSQRKYTIHKAAGDRLTAKELETLATTWNGYISRCARISPRRFAAIHGVPHETWRREYNWGAAHRAIRSGNRWIYAEYDIGKALASRNGGKANSQD